MMIDLGPNTEDAMEVIDFVESGRLFHGGRLPEDFDAAVIHDLEEVPVQWDYCKHLDGRLPWDTICEHACAEYGRKMYEKWAKHTDFPYRPILEKLHEEWTSRLRQQLTGEYALKRAPNRIASDLISCLESRIIVGRQNSLFELIFKIYKSGGFPCGWDGVYPEGRPIVFRPLAPNQTRDHRSIRAVPADLGPHTKEAMEVIDFVESGQFLQGGELLDDLDALIIEDVDDIVPPEGYTFGDDWCDLIGLSQIAEQECHTERQKQSELGIPFPYHRFLVWLRAQWRRRFARELNDEFVKRNLHRDIAGCLVECVENRILMGRRNALLELIFKVCQSGGYPCGWQGNYPKGNIAVYYPPPWQLARRD